MCTKINPLNIKKYWKNQIPPNLTHLDAISQKFTDNYFPPTENSLTSKDSSGNFTDIVNGPDYLEEYNEKNKNHIKDFLPWKRVTDIQNNWKIFNEKINFNEINQGEIGDCYLLSSLQSLIKFPYILREKFRLNIFNKYGYYEIILFIDGEWQIVFIDDYFPFYHKARQFAFSQPNCNEMWVMLIEKAWAKINGGYTNIIGGNVDDSFKALTGFPTERFVHKEIDKYELFNNLEQAYVQGNLLTASSKQNIFDNIGIVEGHAYTILFVRKWLQKGIYLLKLRNPWGKSNEFFLGNYCDSSNLWTNEMKTYFSKNNINEENGIIWVSLNEYLQYFECSNVCHLLFGAQIKYYTFDNKKYFEFPVVFNIFFSQKSKISISVLFKEWRFNRNIINPIRPLVIILAKYDRNRRISKLKTNFSSINNVVLFDDAEEGNYILMIYVDYEHIQNDNDFKYTLQIAVENNYQCQFLGIDKNFELMNYIFLDNFRNEYFDLINNSKNLFFGSYKNLFGLCCLVIINKDPFQWLEININLTYNNYQSLPPFKNLTNLKLIIPPFDGKCIIAIRISNAACNSKYSCTYFFKKRNDFILPSKNFDNLLLFDLKDDELENINKNSYKFVSRRSLFDVPMFFNKNTIDIGNNILRRSKFIINENERIKEIEEECLKKKKIEEEESFKLAIEMSKVEEEERKENELKLIENENIKKAIEQSKIDEMKRKQKIIEENIKRTKEIKKKEEIERKKKEELNKKQLEEEKLIANALKQSLIDEEERKKLNDDDEIMKISKKEKEKIDYKTKVENNKKKENEKKKKLEKENEEKINKLKIEKEKQKKLLIEKFKKNQIETKKLEKLQNEELMRKTLKNFNSEKKLLNSNPFLNQLSLLFPFEFKILFSKYPKLDFFNEKKLKWEREKTPEFEFLGEINTENFKLEGRGILINKNIKYIGYFLDSKYNFKGEILNNNNKLIYEGEFLNGLKNGKGKFFISEFEFFEGEFKNDYLNSNGIYTFENGDVWEGKFENNLKNGIGIYLDKQTGEKIYVEYEKDIFIGQINLNEIDNNKNIDVNNINFNEKNINSNIIIEPLKNPLILPENEIKRKKILETRKTAKQIEPFMFDQVFSIKKINDLDEEEIQIISKGKTKFLGEMKNSKKNGRGCFFNGEFYYIGYFENDKPKNNSYFKKFKSNKKIVFKGYLTSDFKISNNLISKIYYDNGDIYKGFMYDELPNGNGLYMFENGESWLGNFEKGKFNGKGKYFFSNGVISQIVIYENNKIVGKENVIIEEYSVKGNKNFIEENYKKYPKIISRLIKIKPNKFIQGELQYVNIILKDGTQYIGQTIKNTNNLNGKGCFIFKNTTNNNNNNNECFYYIGYVKNNLPDYYGTLYDKEFNITFEGEFDEGVKQGFGKEYYSDGNVYIGNFYNDLPNGLGVFYNINGTIYEGNFLDGQKHEKGFIIDYTYTKIQEVIYKNDDIIEQHDYYEKDNYKNLLRIKFQTDLINQKFPEYSKLIFDLKENEMSNLLNKGIKEDSNGLYIGEFNSIGFKHGRGILLNPYNKEFYLGYFENDEKNGEGKIYYDLNKIKYEGNFLNNEPYGKGKFYYLNGDELKGEFNNLVGQGKGIYKFKDGSFWIGGFYGYYMNGIGNYYDNKGNFIEKQKYNIHKLCKK